jgi:RNA polymerase sigma-70 factor (ECF subfamily)
MKNVKHLSDEELIEVVRSQNQELYREVVWRYQDKLMRYALCLIQNEDKATDVVQEAFIKAFVNLQGFDTSKKFSSWIYRIVHNEAINYFKKQQKEISLDNHQWLEEAIASSEDVEVDFDRREAKKELYQALKELPLKYRSPLILFYLDEKSYEEISDVLRIPVGTVGTRINRGKKMMRVIYKRG